MGERGGGEGGEKGSEVIQSCSRLGTINPFGYCQRNFNFQLFNGLAKFSQFSLGNRSSV